MCSATCILTRVYSALCFLGISFFFFSGGILGISLDCLNTKVSLKMSVVWFLAFSTKWYDINLTLLQNNVNALIDMKLEKHKNLREESAFYWREISDGTLKFDRRESEV